MFSVGSKIKRIMLFKGRDLEDSILFYGVAVLFIIKLILFPYTQTVDADAVTRTLISYNWSKDPYFIVDSVWAPLHFYLNGVIMWISGSIENGPRILNVLLSCLMLIPFYFFVKQEFSLKGAIFSTGMLAMSTAVFRNSFQALSGTPYLFFLAIAIYLFARALRNNSTSLFVWSGLSLSLAAGFRYEAWIIIAVFTLIGLLRRNMKGTLFFWLFAMIIPVGWMLVGQIYHGDFLYGINGAYGWNIERMGVNEGVNDTERLKRLFFFPMSWFLVISPVLGWVISISFFRNVYKKIYTTHQYLWMLPLFILGLAFLVKAQDGTLLLQHRFTASLVFFSAPLLALVLGSKASKAKRLLMVLSVLLIIPQSLFWYRVNLDEYTPLSRQIKSVIRDIQLSTGPDILPLPQLNNEVLKSGMEVLKNNYEKGEGLVIGFFGWTETYAVALQHPESEMFIAPGATNDAFPYDEYSLYLNEHRTGKIVFHCLFNFERDFSFTGSELISNIDTTQMLELQVLYSNKGFYVCSYEVAETNQSGEAQLCLVEGSVAYFESMIYFNIQKLEEAKRLAREYGFTLEKSVLELASELHSKFNNGEIKL